MVFNRKLSLVLCFCLLCAALGGCMNSSLSTEPQAAESREPSPTGASVMPNNTSAVTAAFDWLANGGTVEQKINLLSEIKASRVIVTGSTALVGVTFDSQYQGGMTGRVHDLVAGVVQEADPSVKTVAVTAEKEDVDKIAELAGKLASGTPQSELEAQIDAIVRNVTTMQ